MVAMFQKWQMQDASKAVDKVAALGESRVQFCITLQSEINAQFVPQNFGLLRERRDGEAGNSFYPSDEALRAELKGWCAAAFARAAEHRLAISVLLHLNSHGTIQHWRNDFDFDPLTPLAGASYEDALVRPVLEALEEAVPADWLVQVSLQGEMGRTVFAHPQSWLTLLNRVRQRGKLTRAVFGMSFNHELVSGQVLPGEAQREALKKLWNACDFIGVSMYQRVSATPRAEDFIFNVGRFVGEFSGLGCALPEGKPLHFVEFGLGGGGQSADGAFHMPALTAADAARVPFFGTDKETENPWTVEALTELRRQTYGALCDFLARPMTRHPVRAAYLWNSGSWDVHGLVSPAFADEKIVRRIHEHNRAAQR